MRSDTELCAAWVAGDGHSGGELFNRHYRSLYRFFVNKVANLAEVEELVQQTFVSVIEGRQQYRGDGSFRAYLFGVARKLLLKHYRDQRGREVDPLASSIAQLGPGPATALDLRREQQLLLAALREIPIDSQIVLEMVYWERMSAREIAAALDLSEGAVRARLRKAKLELRGAIDGLARTPAELTSTIDGLDSWADHLRDHWA